MGLVLFKTASRDVPTVSHQDVDDRASSPTHSVNLYRPHERHHYNSEIEDHYIAPGHSQTLCRTISITTNGKQHGNTDAMTWRILNE